VSRVAEQRGALGLCKVYVVRENSRILLKIISMSSLGFASTHIGDAVAVAAIIELGAARGADTLARSP